MTLVDWVVLAVIVGSALFVVRGIYLLRRQIVALGRGASAAARKRPVLWSVPLVLLGLLVAWKGPEWQLASRTASLTAREYLELQNSYRATIVQALGGIFLLLGLYLTWRRVTATEQQVVIAGEGQITERFTRAIEQLGSERLEVRLGGIYALERIARDSEKDHWPIMEVLTAYLRRRTEGSTLIEPIPPDLQAILTVIGRRRVEFERPDQHRLDLSTTNLSSANLSGANLVGAYLRGTKLFRARLQGADLSEAKGLTREQIESAITDEKTKLPDYLKEGGDQ